MFTPFHPCVAPVALLQVPSFDKLIPPASHSHSHGCIHYFFLSSQVPSFDKVLRQYIDGCLRVGALIMRGIALGLQLPEDFFDRGVAGGVLSVCLEERGGDVQTGRQRAQAEGRTVWLGSCGTSLAGECSRSFSCCLFGSGWAAAWRKVAPRWCSSNAWAALGRRWETLEVLNSSTRCCCCPCCCWILCRRLLLGNEVGMPAVRLSPASGRVGRQAESISIATAAAATAAPSPRRSPASLCHQKSHIPWHTVCRVIHYPPLAQGSAFQQSGSEALQASEGANASRAVQLSCGAVSHSAVPHGAVPHGTVQLSFSGVPACFPCHMALCVPACPPAPCHPAGLPALFQHSLPNLPLVGPACQPRLLCLLADLPGSGLPACLQGSTPIMGC